MRLIHTIILFLALTVSLAAQGQKLSLIDAVQAYSDADYRKASEMLDRIIADDPGNDAAYYYRALCGVNLDREPKLCEEDLKKACSLDTANYWYKETLARLYTASSQNELATSEYEGLLKAFPKKTDSYYALVNLYLREGDMDKALSTISEIETVMGKNDGTVMTKYRILLQQKKQEEAHQELKAYCEEYSSPQILSMLGDYETGIYNDSTATAYYLEALSLDKDYMPAKMGLAEVYRMTRKYPEYWKSVREMASDAQVPSSLKTDYLQSLLQQTDARFRQTFSSEIDSVMEISMACHPRDSLVTSMAGSYYFATDRQDRALELFKDNAGNYPTSITATGQYLQILGYAKKWRELADGAESAYKRFPGEPSFLDMASSGYYYLKDYKSVIRVSEQIVATAKGDTSLVVPALANIGDMYQKLGETGKSYKAYQNALDINPDYAPCLNNYAWNLALSGKELKKAYKMSKRTVELEPDNVTYLDTFGWILHLQGKDLEAKGFFKHAMLYGGKDSKAILEHYAEVLESLGETDLAKVYSSQAEAKPDEEE